MKELSQIDKVRAFIAGHLHIDVRRVTDEAHFTEDLGVDWLDCIELMIRIEEQFTGLEITAGNADHFSVVGDLIRYVEGSARACSTTLPEN